MKTETEEQKCEGVVLVPETPKLFYTYGFFQEEEYCFDHVQEQKTAFEFNGHFPVKRFIFVNERGNVRVLLSDEQGTEVNRQVNALFHDTNLNLHGNVLMITAKPLSGFGKSKSSSNNNANTNGNNQKKKKKNKKNVQQGSVDNKRTKKQ